VVFSTQEALTSNATGISEGEDYLYLRNAANETTELLDVNEKGELLTPYSASLGSSLRLEGNRNVPAGTVTHAISADGTRIFFEVPEEAGGSPAHLYMRDLTTQTTTPIDDPASPSTARYEGASANGSLVFFTSEEALDGGSSAKELYVFNTTSQAIGPVPGMTAVPISKGEVMGVTAIANDGSRVYYVATNVQAKNANPLGGEAVEGEPNLYMYDAQTEQTTYVATLSWLDVRECNAAACSVEEQNGGLVAEPDTARPATPTPDGATLVFTSLADVTGESHGVQTTLTAEVEQQQDTFQVASTAGLAAKGYVAIGSGAAQRRYEISQIDSPTELTVAETVYTAIPAGATLTQLIPEIYRYGSSEGRLVCVSCSPRSVTGARLPSDGGSYSPHADTAAMNESASEIFFESADELVPGVPIASAASLSGSTANIYEWENGKVSLVVDGKGTLTAFAGTTANGADMFFASEAQFTSVSSGGRLWVYDARVDGGFPEAVPPPPCSEDCRPSEATVFFPEPGSATLLATESPIAPLARAPKWAIVPIGAASRKSFVRTGKVTVTVLLPAPGTVSGVVTARWGGAAHVVARGHTAVGEAGEARISLKLSAAVRRMLAKRGSLTLKLKLRYSASPVVEGAKLTLSSPHASAARRSSGGGRG
jgi:hypothetical protein